MASTIRKYLAEVEERLVDTVDDRKLQEILAETESHLRESAEEIKEVGFTRLEAEHRAIAAFGDAEGYGVAVQEVEVVADEVSPRLMIGASCVATGALLLWVLLAKGYPWYHPDETIKTIATFVAAPLLCVVVAAFLGSKVRARRLFVIASAASLILVMLLATRFVGSGMSGGFVVRSIQPRETAIDQPGFLRSAAKAYQTGLVELKFAKALAVQGVLSTTLTPKGMQFLAPAQESVGFDSKPAPLKGYLAPEDAWQAWHSYGESKINHDEDGLSTYSRMADESQKRLDEPFLYRLFSMATYAPLVTLVWGITLMWLQALGLAIRRGLLRVMLSKHWSQVKALLG